MPNKLCVSKILVMQDFLLRVERNDAWLYRDSEKDRMIFIRVA